MIVLTYSHINIISQISQKVVLKNYVKKIFQKFQFSEVSSFPKKLEYNHATTHKTTHTHIIMKMIFFCKNIIKISIFFLVISILYFVHTIFALLLYMTAFLVSILAVSAASPARKTCCSILLIMSPYFNT